MPSVCCGSEEAAADAGDVHTTLFQNYLGSTAVGAAPVYWDDTEHADEINRTVRCADTITCLVCLRDAVGHGYSVSLSPGQTLRLTRGAQSSPGPSGESSSTQTAAWATAFLDHGSQPTSATYEYAVLMDMAAEEIASFHPASEYHVLSQADNLHAVSRNASKEHGVVHEVAFVAFAALEREAAPLAGVLRRTSAPCAGTIAFNQSQQPLEVPPAVIRLTVANPDLGYLDEGLYSSFNVRSGIQAELYARPSRPATTVLTLQGTWTMGAEEPTVVETLSGFHDGNYSALWSTEVTHQTSADEDGVTTLRVVAQNGLSIAITLERRHPFPTSPPTPPSLPPAPPSAPPPASPPPPPYMPLPCFSDRGRGFAWPAFSNRRCGTCCGANDTASFLCQGTTWDGKVYLNHSEAVLRCAADSECVGFSEHEDGYVRPVTYIGALTNDGSSKFTTYERCSSPPPAVPPPPEAPPFNEYFYCGTAECGRALLTAGWSPVIEFGSLSPSRFDGGTVDSEASIVAAGWSELINRVDNGCCFTAPHTMQWYRTSDTANGTLELAPLPNGTYDLLIGWGGAACYVEVSDDTGVTTVGPATKRDPEGIYEMVVTELRAVNLAGGGGRLAFFEQKRCWTSYVLSRAVAPSPPPAPPVPPPMPTLPDTQSAWPAVLLKRYVELHGATVAGPNPRPEDWALERSRQAIMEPLDVIIARHNISSWATTPFDLDEDADAEAMEDLIRWNLVDVATALAATPHDHPRRNSLVDYFEGFARGLSVRGVRGDAFDPQWDDSSYTWCNKIKMGRSEAFLRLSSGLGKTAALAREELMSAGLANTSYESDGLLAALGYFTRWGSTNTSALAYAYACTHASSPLHVPTSPRITPSPTCHTLLPSMQDIRSQLPFGFPAIHERRCVRLARVEFGRCKDTGGRSPAVLPSAHPGGRRARHAAPAPGHAARLAGQVARVAFGHGGRVQARRVHIPPRHVLRQRVLDLYDPHGGRGRVGAPR